jgi:hypothetical protein
LSTKIIRQPVWREFERQFSSVQFCAERPDQLSIWHGWGFEPKENPAALVHFHALVDEVVGNGDPVQKKVALDWAAYSVRHLNEHNEFGLVLVGGQGSGKTSFFKALCRLWGKEFAADNVNDMNQILGPFALEVLAWRKMVVCNELQDIDAKGGVNWQAMKSRIGDPTFTSGRKYESNQTLPNVACFGFTTNVENSVSIPKGDRHYCLVEISDCHKGDKPFFDAFYAEMKKPEFKPALLWELFNRDLSGYDPSNPPQTALKLAVEKEQEPDFIFFIDNRAWTASEKEAGLTLEDLHDECYEFYQRHHVSKPLPSLMKFARRIKDHVGVVARTNHKAGNKTRYFPLEGAQIIPEFGAEFVEPAESAAE